MTEKGEKLLILAAGLFLILSIGVVVFMYQLDESVPLAEGENPEALEETMGGEYFEAAFYEDADIVIPLPEGDKEQFHIEESAGGKKLTVVLDEVEEGFFAQNKIRGNEEKISRIQLIKEEKTTSLIFTFSHVFESNASLEGGEIRLKLTNPMTSYEKIIVLDGVSEEFEKEIERAFTPCEIKGIFNGDVGAANELRAECFVSLERELITYYGAEGYGAQGSVPENYTEIVIYYNDDYFIPEFDSRSLAEIIEDHYNEFHDDWTVILVKSNDADLKSAMVPAVKIVYRTPLSAPGETVEKHAFGKDSVEELTIDALVLQYGGKEE